VLFIILTSAGIVNAQTTDELHNGSFEEQGDSLRTAYDWQNFGSGYRRVAAPHTGLWSIRLSKTAPEGYAGAYQRVDLNQTEEKPVFIGGYIKGRRIVNHSDSFVGASLYVEIHLRDGSVAYWNSIRNKGSFPWRWVGFNTGTLASVNQPIDHIFIIPILGDGITGTANFDDIVVTEFIPTQSAVTLMFDDGEITTLTEAKPVLDSHGLIGSAVIITDVIGEEGFMGPSDIRELAQTGWEIVSHGLTHSDLTTLNTFDVRKEFRNSRRILQRLGLAVKNFALPFGAYNAEILAEGFKYYGSIRAYEQGNNPQGVFPLDVKVRGVLDSTTPEEVEAWVANAQTNNEWAVIVFHSIVNEGDDAYHTAPDIFAEMIQKIAESGVSVVTYDKGLELFAITQ